MFTLVATRRFRGRWLRLVSLVILLAGASTLVACGGSPTSVRGPVRIMGGRTGSTPMQVLLLVASCHGHPKATIHESASTVSVEIVSTTNANGPGCADGVTLSLRDPLGARAVEDLSDHKPVTIRNRQ